MHDSSGASFLGCGLRGRWCIEKWKWTFRGIGEDSFNTPLANRLIEVSRKTSIKVPRHMALLIAYGVPSFYGSFYRNYNELYESVFKTVL